MREFLDVDVDQVADPVVLVTDDFTQMLARGRVEVAQPVETSADQDAVDGGWRERDAVQSLKVGGEAGGPVLGLPPQRLHQVRDVLRGAGRAGDRAGGVVEQAVIPVRAPARVPLRQAAAGDPGFRRDVRDRTPGVHALT